MTNKLMCIVITTLCMLTVTAVQAAPKILKKGSLVCDSEQSYDTQIKYIASKVDRFARGCGALNKNYEVVIIDLNFLSGSEVQVIDTGANVWVSADDIK